MGVIEMMDKTTNQPLRLVVAPNNGGAFLRLPYLQVEELRQVLDAQGIRYWVEEMVYSYNGGPQIAIVQFGKNNNPETIQAILDSIC